MISQLREFIDLQATLDVVVSMLDFLIVYFVVYQVLMLIRGTRAVQMLVGLLFVIVGYFVTKDEYLGLTTINWLLDKFIGSFILVVVVLFQQDIRRGLTTLARSPLFSGLSSSKEALRVEELVRACSMLAQHNLGGLMVIERRGDLSQFTDEAVRIDAIVSKEALFAIFNPANANPLHDGAVVIRDDRIVCAGAFLPLTSNPRVPKHLGTRHRAAIGLSEDTDAVVVVVSEETAEISIAVNGELRHGLSPNTVRQELQNLLGVKAETKGTAPAAGAVP
jgi:diadenylate cyclase